MPLGTASASHGAAGLLDRLQFGVVLYAHDGSIASLNRHAADLLARSRSLTLRGEALHCHDAVQRGRLAQLLADGRAGRGGILQIEAAGDPPLTLLTVPLAPAASAPQDAPGEPDVLRFALVFGMRDVSSRAALDAFSALYRLTPAEGRVLEAFVRDRSPEDIARSGGVSVRTVRTQLSSIYGKTGVAGQRELLLRLREVPPFALR